jgi:hypothetical protein
MKKTIYTLNLHPEKYADITAITYPLLKHYAKKIGAEFVEITDRKFPEWPPTFEKLQVYELGKAAKNDWNIFFDADAMIHPDTADYTALLSRDTCAHNGADMAAFRFKYDKFYLRDGRNIGSATWLCIASDWTIEMFEPPKDITPAEVEKMIFPTTNELKNGVEPIRLVEDFIVGRNIAKYGLKFTTLKELNVKLGLGDLCHFFHIYATSKEIKITKMMQVLQAWGLAE